MTTPMTLDEARAFMFLRINLENANAPVHVRAHMRLENNHARLTRGLPVLRWHPKHGERECQLVEVDGVRYEVSWLERGTYDWRPQPSETWSTVQLEGPTTLDDVIRRLARRTQ